MSKSALVKERITAAIDRMGRYQILIILLMNVNNTAVGINHTLTSFLTYIPKFFCVDSQSAQYETVSNISYTTNTNAACMGLQSESCHFDPNDAITVTSEYGLVCEKRFLGPLTSTAYFIGVTFGALILGSLSDKFGRKKMIIACIISALIFGIAIHFSPASIFVLMALRLGQGFFIQGMQTITYTLVVEYTPVRFRNFIACFWPVYFGMGLIYLGGVSYITPDWRELQLYLQLPILVPLVACWFVVESPFWMLSKNMLDEASDNYRKIAQLNKDDEFLATEEVHNQQQLELIRHGEKREIITEEKSAIEESPDAPQQSNVLQLFKNAILRKHLLSMAAIWFTMAISYYGILFSLPNLPGNRHMNFIMGALIEISAVVVQFYLFTKYGRKRPMIGYQMLNGVICILIALISFFKTPEPSLLNTLLVACALFGKGLAVSLFCGMNLYAVELFPTIVRGTAIGICGFSARVGSLLAPQLMVLGEIFAPWVPMAVIGGSLITAGMSLFILPETKTIQIPNTVEDANRLWGKRQSTNGKA